MSRRTSATAGRPVPRPARPRAAALVVAVLAAWGGPAGGVAMAAPAAAPRPIAATSGVYFVDATPGATPFIGFTRFQGSALSDLASVAFRIAPRAGATAAPVRVSYSTRYLKAHGYLVPGQPLVVPVFGLYAGETNQVTVTFTFRDGSRQALGLPLAAAPYADPHGVYDHPRVNTPRDASMPLGYSYLYVKSGIASPVIIDVDGALRWVGPEVPTSFSSTFVDGTFVIGGNTTPVIYHMGLDGTLSQTSLALPGVRDFDHDMSPGREAILAGVNTVSGDVTNFQSTTVEMTADGQVLRTWDFAKIIGDWMTSQGDDASLFVKPGQNWLHINAQYYDPRDDSLVISSREQFVMKVDYDTGAIKWLLGDPTKWWHQFPSLRAKALSGPKDRFWPIGQHGITLGNRGELLLFNNGAPSDNMPPGQPKGEARPYSAVSGYRIDEVGRKATDVYRFDHGQTIRASVCSSVHQATDGSMVIDWASAEDATAALLTGLDQDGHVAFEYQYLDKGCATAWHTDLIPLEDLSLK